MKIYFNNDQYDFMFSEAVNISVMSIQTFFDIPFENEVFADTFGVYTRDDLMNQLTILVKNGNIAAWRMKSDGSFSVTAYTKMLDYIAE